MRIGKPASGQFGWSRQDHVGRKQVHFSPRRAGTPAGTLDVTLTMTSVVLDREGRVVYFGRYAQEALDGVLAGTGVKISNTNPDGREIVR